MPLVITTLERQILNAFQTVEGATDGRAAQQQLASLLAQAIDSYIRSAIITLPPGQLVSGTAGPTPVVAATSATSPPATIS